MGMSTLTHWVCDGCDTTEIMDQGLVPKGWKASALLDLHVDPEDNHLDYRQPNLSTLKVICDKCVQRVERISGVERNEPAETDSPVVPESDKSVVSPPEASTRLVDEPDPSEYDALVDDNNYGRPGAQGMG